VRDRRPVVSFVTWGSSGGAFARIARGLAQGFAEIGVPFDVVYLEGPREIWAEKSSRYVRLGSVRARRSVPGLTRYLRSQRPSLTLVSPGHLVPFTLLAGHLSSQAVVPWEQTFLSFDLEELAWKMRVQPTIQRVTYPRAPAIAVVSEDIGSHLQEAMRLNVPKERLFTLPNPLDAAEIRRLASPPQSRNGGFRLLAAGRLTKQKGFDVLLEALALADQKLPQPWDLVILGQGPQESELQNLAEARGIADRVSLVGHVKNPYPIMASSDLFVHPARWEGFGVVLTEALGLGIPIVATTCPGGPHEILRDGKFGILVPPGQPETLADALILVAKDARLRTRLAERGLERALDYAPALVARRVVALAEFVGGREAQLDNAS
jgi:glycosyltransferase involved in cell wall biosynthesis